MVVKCNREIIVLNKWLYTSAATVVKNICFFFKTTNNFGLVKSQRTIEFHLVHTAAATEDHRIEKL